MSKSMATATAVLEDPLRNRGAAFTVAERDALGLTGRLPSGVLTLDEQARRVYDQLGRQPGDLAKNVYLEQLHDRNEVLYYKVISDHLAELLPVVYDPTVGDAIERYSHEYRRPRGLFLSIDQPDDMQKAFASLQLGPAPTVRRGHNSLYRAGPLAALPGSYTCRSTVLSPDPSRCPPLCVSSRATVWRLGRILGASEPYDHGLHGGSSSHVTTRG